MKIKLSDFLSLNTQDFVKGLIMAVLGAVITVIQNSFAAGEFTLDWTNIWHIAAGAFVAYLVKNFFTPQPDTIVIDPKKTDVETTTGRKVA